MRTRFDQPRFKIINYTEMYIAIMRTSINLLGTVVATFAVLINRTLKSVT